MKNSVKRFFESISEGDIKRALETINDNAVLKHKDQIQFQSMVVLKEKME